MWSAWTSDHPCEGGKVVWNAYAVGPLGHDNSLLRPRIFHTAVPCRIDSLDYFTRVNNRPLNLLHSLRISNKDALLAKRNKVFLLFESVDQQVISINQLRLVVQVSLIFQVISRWVLLFGLVFSMGEHDKTKHMRPANTASRRLNQQINTGTAAAPPARQ